MRARALRDFFLRQNLTSRKAGERELPNFIEYSTYVGDAEPSA